MANIDTYCNLDTLSQNSAQLCFQRSTMRRFLHYLIPIILVLGGNTAEIRAQVYNVLGTITGAPSPVELTLTGATVTITTNSMNIYAFTGLTAATYTITPVLAGYGFTPGIRWVMVTNADIFTMDFSATPLVSMSTTISSFTPTFGTAGTSVVISGQGFIGTQYVFFGGTHANSFVVDSDTQITAVVGTGATGQVAVITPLGTATRTGFTFSSTGSTTNTVISSPGAPSITTFANLTVFANTPTPALSFAINDASTASVNLAVQGVSGNQTLLPNTNIIFSGTDSNRTVRLVPAANQVGSALVTISVYNAVLASSSTSFVLNVVQPQAPTITQFTPSSAAQGTTVTITGTGFTGTTQVKFGTSPADSIRVVSDTQIIAIVGNGSSGSVVVTTPGGTVAAPGFTFLSPRPLIAGFSPKSGASGTNITLYGQHFTGVTEVKFGGIAAASIQIISDTQISAVVGSGASGVVTAGNSGGIGTSADLFTYLTSPSISGFEPRSGSQGSEILIFGFGFTGVTQVTFGGIPATSVTFLSDTQIRAIVGNGSTGAVSVTAPGGTTSLAGFTFVPQSSIRINTFTPSSAAIGTTVIITGAGFTGTTQVTFGGVASNNVVVGSDGQLSAVVPAGAQSGDITVTSPLGTARAPGFIILAQATLQIPAIANQVIAANSNFVQIPFSITASNPSTVSVSATSSDALLFPSNNISVVGSGLSWTFVATPAANQSGAATITLRATDGQLVATRSFVITVTPPPAPTITRFSPTGAGAGETVTIFGQGLTGATQVTFGGVSALSVTPVSDTQIIVLVAAGASGEVAVVTPRGTARLAGFTFVTSPVLTDFSPKFVNGSGQVMLVGRGFTGVTQVSIGGFPANILSVADDRIVVEITTGMSGFITLITPRGSASKEWFTYIPPGKAAAPVMSFVPHQVLQTNTSTGALFISVRDDNFPADSIKIFASSTNQALLPDANIVLSGKGTNRFITMTPALNQSGKTLVTLVAFNGLLSSKQEFEVLVNQESNIVVRGSKPAFRLFPTPTKGVLTLEAECFAPTHLLISAYAVNGQRVWVNREYWLAGFHQTSYALDFLPAGIYWVEIFDGKHRFTEKIIKE